MDRRFDIWRKHHTIGAEPPFEIPDTAYISAISAGADHALFLTNTGQVYSCGANGYGQLARVTPSGSTTDVNLGLISGLSNVVEVIASNRYSFFRLANGEVWGAGGTSSGQLGPSFPSGNPTTLNLGVISGLPAIKSLSSEGGASFFLTEDGKVYSCGDNYYGQLGRNNEEAEPLALIPGLSNVHQIAAGQNHTLFLLKNGRVYGCGNNDYNQLNNQNYDDYPNNYDIRPVNNVSRITQIAVGYSCSFFLHENGKVLACGDNMYGRLGKTSYWDEGNLISFGYIPNLNNIVQISAGWQHTLFVNSSQQIYSCGENSRGQLGRLVNDGGMDSPNLGLIPSLSAISVAAGTNFSYFRQSNGDHYNCGENTFGQLGRIIEDGSETSNNVGLITI
jgi:alpha-tubulin suppressor-like RCC1 family protein